MANSKKSTKLPTKRSRYKYPALEKSANLKSRQSGVDDVKEYFHKLSPQEKEWMNNFMEEYNNANFNHPGEKIHKTKKQKKDCYNSNNARNRCIMTKEQAKGTLEYYEKVEDLDKMDDVLESNNEIDSSEK